MVLKDSLWWKSGTQNGPVPSNEITDMSSAFITILTRRPGLTKVFLLDWVEYIASLVVRLGENSFFYWQLLRTWLSRYYSCAWQCRSPLPPPNVTILVQLLDAVIIASVKIKFRRLLLFCVFDNLDEGRKLIYNIDILRAIRLVQEEWEGLELACFEFCFNHCFVEQIQ